MNPLLIGALLLGGTVAAAKVIKKTEDVKKKFPGKPKQGECISINSPRPATKHERQFAKMMFGKYADWFAYCDEGVPYQVLYDNSGNMVGWVKSTITLTPLEEAVAFQKQISPELCELAEIMEK